MRIKGTRVPLNKKARKFSYAVAIPVPRVDRAGLPVSTEKLEAGIGRLIRGMALAFGGAKLMRSPGAYRMGDGRLVLDEDEPVIVSFTRRSVFRARRKAIIRLVEQVGAALDQEAMAVLACRAEGLLIFTEEEA